MDFPWIIPIPVDFHVKNVSISSGIIESCNNDDMFRRVWHEVLKIVRKRVNKHITLLRVDSLVWQSGKIISENKFNKSLAYRGLYTYFMGEVGLNKDISKGLAEEFTYNLNIP